MPKIKIVLTHEIEHEINFENYPSDVQTVEQVIEFEKGQVANHVFDIEWDSKTVEIKEIKPEIKDELSYDLK